jgi:hypothetical protein
VLGAIPIPGPAPPIRCSLAHTPTTLTGRSVFLPGASVLGTTLVLTHRASSLSPMPRLPLPRRNPRTMRAASASTPRGIGSRSISRVLRFPTLLSSLRRLWLARSSSKTIGGWKSRDRLNPFRARCTPPVLRRGPCFCSIHHNWAISPGASFSDNLRAGPNDPPPTRALLPTKAVRRKPRQHLVYLALASVDLI